MKMRMYSIRDVKSGFLSPTLEMADEIAIRNFEHAFMVSDKNSLFYTHAADYSLYCIAEFETDSGVVTPLVVPELIYEATAVRKE